MAVLILARTVLLRDSAPLLFSEQKNFNIYPSLTDPCLSTINYNYRLLREMILAFQKLSVPKSAQHFLLQTARWLRIG